MMYGATSLADASRHQRAHGNSRVEVPATDVTDGIGHGDDGEAKGQGHAQQADSDFGERGGQHGAAAATEHQPEST
jgi:hypothetical protein